MSMNAKERLQALRRVEEQKAQSKEQEIRAKVQALGLSVLEGGLGNGWKN